ncbi:hypothetical protein H4R33_004850 [Dimargaris cristalligena]|nr:hypothetical protein H4R33_004850 [Dimargaris cristalligena]
MVPRSTARFSYRQWLDHTSRQLDYNALSLTLRNPTSPANQQRSAFRSRSSDAACGAGERDARPGTSSSSTVRIQYTFDASHHFPHPFLSIHPQFTTAVDPRLRTLPRILLILHGTYPAGGYDVARWYAAGIAQAATNLAEETALGSASTNLPDPSPSLPDSQRISPHHYSAPLGLLALSRPGYLGSSALAHHPTFEQEAALIQQFLNMQGIARVSILGIGTGAQVALHLRHQQPNTVDRLILVDPVWQKPRAIRLAWLRARALLWDETMLTSWLGYRQWVAQQNSTVQGTAKTRPIPPSFFSSPSTAQGESKSLASSSNSRSSSSGSSTLNEGIVDVSTLKTLPASPSPIRPKSSPVSTFTGASPPSSLFWQNSRADPDPATPNPTLLQRCAELERSTEIFQAWSQMRYPGIRSDLIKLGHLNQNSFDLLFPTGNDSSALAEEPPHLSSPTLWLSTGASSTDPTWLATSPAMPPALNSSQSNHTHTGGHGSFSPKQPSYEFRQFQPADGQEPSSILLAELSQTVVDFLYSP